MLGLPSFESRVTFADVSDLRTRHLTLLNLRVRERNACTGCATSRLQAAFTLPRYFFFLRNRELRRDQENLRVFPELEMRLLSFQIETSERRFQNYQ